MEKREPAVLGEGQGPKGAPARKSNRAKARVREALGRSRFGLPLARVVKTIFLSIHAHSFLLFFFIPISRNVATSLLGYLIFSLFSTFLSS